MTDILHQFWFGTMPERVSRWCASMRDFASGIGYGYRLDSFEDVARLYPRSPFISLFREMFNIAPNATTASLFSDWYRVRILADEGGIYADSDFYLDRLPEWRPSADVSLFGEKAYSEQLATGLTWCRGERGREALKLAADEVERHLLASFGSPSDDDFAQRFIDLVRTDRAVDRGFSLVGLIGPRFIRQRVFPRWKAQGYTFEAIPRDVAANLSKREHLKTSPAIWHYGAGSWRLKKGWDSLAASAVERDRAAAERKEARSERLSALPPHLRPQGAAILPDFGRTSADIAPEGGKITAGTLPASVRTIFRVPRSARRIVIFSNVTRGFDFGAIGLREGDFCVHINRAKHFREAFSVPGTSHVLLVRHGANPRTKKRIWFIPSGVDFEGFEQVAFVNDHFAAGELPAWKEYYRLNPDKHPTSGWIAAVIFRALAPRLPLILAGFDPANNHGTCMWSGHAWMYEAEYYRKHHFNAIPPRS